jgi:hypothetical protein
MSQRVHKVLDPPYDGRGKDVAVRVPRLVTFIIFMITQMELEGPRLGRQRYSPALIIRTTTNDFSQILLGYIRTIPQLDVSGGLNDHNPFMSH